MTDHFAEAERLLKEAEDFHTVRTPLIMAVVDAHLKLDEIQYYREAVERDLQRQGQDVKTPPEDEFGDTELPVGIGAVVQTADGTTWIRNGADYPGDKQFWKPQGSSGTWQPDSYFEPLRFRVLSEGMQL